MSIASPNSATLHFPVDLLHLKRLKCVQCVQAQQSQQNFTASDGWVYHKIHWSIPYTSIWSVTPISQHAHCTLCKPCSSQRCAFSPAFAQAPASRDYVAVATIVEIFEIQRALCVPLYTVKVIVCYGLVEFRRVTWESLEVGCVCDVKVCLQNTSKEFLASYLYPGCNVLWISGWE